MINMKNFDLDYSRVEVAQDARHRVCSCGPSPQSFAAKQIQQDWLAWKVKNVDYNEK